jgi:inorganic pyrophosphatase
MDEPAFPGCKLTCRMVGVIEGEQGAKKKRERNDRIVAVESGNHSYAHVKRIDDLGKSFEREIEEFFVNYHHLTGTEYHILALTRAKSFCRFMPKCHCSRPRFDQPAGANDRTYP